MGYSQRPYGINAYRKVVSLHPQLAADLRARRPGVVADLLAEHGAAIGGVPYLIVRDAADAEEIVMDTIETAWRQADKLREDAALRTWLLRIATRHALTRRRRHRTTQTLEQAVGIEFPTPGCWQLTAEYRGAALSYVVWIKDE